jgi:hypothetical protein
VVDTGWIAFYLGNEPIGTWGFFAKSGNNSCSGAVQMVEVSFETTLFIGTAVYPDGLLLVPIPGIQWSRGAGSHRADVSGHEGW